jgi:SAM-dependent methyltransferase
VQQVALAAARGISAVHHGDIMDHLRDRRGVYDAIVALDLLEHFNRAELLAVLDVIRAALRPGGSLLARTPNAASPFFGRYQFGDLTHETAFTATSMRQALQVTGFEMVDAMPSNPVPYGVVSGVRLLCWHVLASCMKACLFVETGQLRGHVVTQNLFVQARRPGSETAAGSSA